MSAHEVAENTTVYENKKQANSANEECTTEDHDNQYIESPEDDNDKLLLNKVNKNNNEEE